MHVNAMQELQYFKHLQTTVKNQESCDKWSSPVVTGRHAFKSSSKVTVNSPSPCTIVPEK
jgi:hypothetical protein